MSQNDAEFLFKLDFVVASIMNTKNLYFRGFLAICLVMVVLHSSPVLAARWYQNYEKAQQAMEKKEWQTAIDLLEDAIDSESEPDGHKRTYGMYFIEYYPYLKLGLAYLEVGDIEKAKENCQISKDKEGALKDEAQKCLDRATQTSPASVQEAHKKKLVELLQQELILPQHFSCAFQMITQGETNESLEGLLSGKVSPAEFNEAFECEIKKEPAETKE